MVWFVHSWCCLCLISWVCSFVFLFGSELWYLIVYIYWVYGIWSFCDVSLYEKFGIAKCMSLCLCGIQCSVFVLPYLVCGFALGVSLAHSMFIKSGINDIYSPLSVWKFLPYRLNLFDLLSLCAVLSFFCYQLFLVWILTNTLFFLLTTWLLIWVYFHILCFALVVDFSECL